MQKRTELLGLLRMLSLLLWNINTSWRPEWGRDELTNLLCPSSVWSESIISNPSVVYFINLDEMPFKHCVHCCKPSWCARTCFCTRNIYCLRPRLCCFLSDTGLSALVWLPGLRGLSISWHQWVITDLSENLDSHVMSTNRFLLEP